MLTTRTGATLDHLVNSWVKYAHSMSTDFKAYFIFKHWPFYQIATKCRNLLFVTPFSDLLSCSFISFFLGTYFASYAP